MLRTVERRKNANSLWLVTMILLALLFLLVNDYVYPRENNSVLNLLSSAEVCLLFESQTEKCGPMSCSSVEVGFKQQELFQSWAQKRFVISYGHHGFGNQLFQHTYAVLLARRLNAQVVISAHTMATLNVSHRSNVESNTATAFNAVKALLPAALSSDNTNIASVCSAEPSVFPFMTRPPLTKEANNALRRNFNARSESKRLIEQSHEPSSRLAKPSCFKLWGFFQVVSSSHFPSFCHLDARALWLPALGDLFSRDIPNDRHNSRDNPSFPLITNFPGRNDVAIYLRCAYAHYPFDTKSYYSKLFSNWSLRSNTSHSAIYLGGDGTAWPTRILNYSRGGDERTSSTRVGSSSSRSSGISDGEGAGGAQSKTNIWLFEAPDCGSLGLMRKVKGGPALGNKYKDVVRWFTDTLGAERWRPSWAPQSDSKRRARNISPAAWLLLADFKAISSAGYQVLPASTWAFWAALLSPKDTVVHISHTTPAGKKQKKDSGNGSPLFPVEMANRVWYHDKAQNRYFGRYDVMTGQINWSGDKRGA